MAIAIFSTWTTYGTWLPGDSRWWYQGGVGGQPPDNLRQFEALLQMTESAYTLDLQERKLVEDTIAEHCARRNWELLAVNCRSNHIHTLVAAPEQPIELPREQFKAWCTRRLKHNALMGCGAHYVRKNWWSERGWDVYVDTEEVLSRLVDYVLDGQGPARC